MAVIFESSCLNEPAAALRGLAKGLLLVANIDSLSLAKPALGIYTSPLTSKCSGQPVPCNFNGTLRMVQILAVISSPVTPSPLVAPCEKIPCS